MSGDLNLGEKIWSHVVSGKGRQPVWNLVVDHPFNEFSSDETQNHVNKNLMEDSEKFRCSSGLHKDTDVFQTFDNNANSPKAKLTSKNFVLIIHFLST